MAKRRRSTTGQRGTIATSNRRLSAPSLLDSLRLMASLSTLREIEDRRQFHPERQFRAARSLSKPLHRLVVSSTPKGRMPVGVRFEDPHKVLVCVRRNQRKEVLHALRKTGKGKAAKRPRRRSYYTDVRC